MSVGQRCQLDPETQYVLFSPPVLLVQLLVLLDLALTVTGITKGAGVEVNPFFAPLTEMGVLPMLAGIVFYYIVLWVFFLAASDWVRAIGVGFLTAIHTYGFLSWVRLLFVEWVNIFFSNIFYLMTGPALLASIMTIYTYVDIRTCPAPLDLSLSSTEPGSIKWE